MTLTELRYIVTLAREQHFGHAAENALSVSRHSLSPLKSWKMSSVSRCLNAVKTPYV